MRAKPKPSKKNKEKINKKCPRRKMWYPATLGCTLRLSVVGIEILTLFTTIRSVLFSFSLGIGLGLFLLIFQV